MEEYNTRARGITLSNSININSQKISDDVKNANMLGYPTDIDVSVANTIAHELGHHVIAGQSDNDETKAVDRLAVESTPSTEELDGVLGHFWDKTLVSFR